MMILSFVHDISWVIPALVLQYIRNVLPLWDPEVRREVIGPIEWNIMTLI